MALEGEKVVYGDSYKPLGDKAVTIKVENDFSIYTFRAALIQRMELLNLSKVFRDELEIIGKELATNIIKHAGGSGIIIFSHLENEENTVIYVDAIDQGPGFKDFEEALQGGFSTTGSLGEGIPTIRRLSDLLELVRSEKNGSHLRITKVFNRFSVVQSPWEFSLFCRPLPGEKCNGDQGIIIHRDTYTDAILADGLGHGFEASRASSKAIDWLTNNPGHSLQEQMRLVHRVLRGTRGSAISIARIHFLDNIIEWLALGNVSGWLVNRESERERRFYNNNGTLGVNITKLISMKYEFKKNDILVMASDGMYSNCLDLMKENLNMPIQKMGHKLLQETARDHDDASILLGRVKSQL